MNKISTDEFVSLISEQFSKHASLENAEAMSKYMRNRFKFYGLKSELRKTIQKDFLSIYQLSNAGELKELITKLWMQSARECHYFALDILEKSIRKADESWMPLLEKLISENSWWDSVDIVATKLIGNYLKRHEHFRVTYPEGWIKSENFWFRRTALLYQLKYKQDTNFDQLKTFILRTAHEKEFFIQKAQGWALREYAKTNRVAVYRFVAENDSILNKRCKRETMRSKA